MGHWSLRLLAFDLWHDLGAKGTAGAGLGERRTPKCFALVVTDPGYVDGHHPRLVHLRSEALVMTATVQHPVI